MRFRPAAVLLASLVLLLSATDASAAGSNLSTAPPGQMPTRTASQSTDSQASGTLPRTGLDVGLEALLAVMLLAGGAAFRAASPALLE